MPASAKKARVRRERRHRSIRRRLSGTEVRPRLNVFRSSANIYVQVIDDVRGHTLVAASTLEAPAREQVDKTSQARAVGQLAAERARAAGVTKVVFDRGGYLYHGRVKAVAEAARAAGLEF
ncbi:MAG: 50S ribosomal protein L18 [Chloroflexota bacterium]